jgi:hypothetical protein
MISQQTADRLSVYVSDDQPFGPPDASDIAEPDCIAALFSWDNHVFADLIRGSHMIVGRRGAGKTALVSSYKGLNEIVESSSVSDLADFREKYGLGRRDSWAGPDMVVTLKVPDELDWMQRNYAGLQGARPPVEVVAGHWRVRFWDILASQLAKKLPKRGYPEVHDATKSGVSETVLRAFTAGERLQDDPLSGLEAIVKQTVERAGIRVALILDSMDEYTLSDSERLIFSGMFRATGQLLAAPRAGIDIKCCVPAEMFDVLYRTSVNPDKDFHKIQFLNWSSEELFRIAAHRLKVYLYLRDRTQLDDLESIDTRIRSALWSFWWQFLPREVTNKLGQLEHSPIYILRHTHLLPRQLIMILNSIARISRASGQAIAPNSGDAAQLTAEAIQQGLAKIEFTNATTILSMYQNRYPLIQELFRLVLPRLKHTFSYGDLYKIWRSSGRVMMTEMEKPDFQHFWRLLLSTCAIGVVRENYYSERYIEGQFEFNSPQPLFISDKDELCLHPMFSGAFASARGKDPRVIIPRGIDLRFDERD